MRAATLLNLLFSSLAPPVNTVAPSIAGTNAVGQTLTVTPGTWTNSPTLTYQWTRDGANIGGATSTTYILVDADAGTTTKVLEIPNGVTASGVYSNSQVHPLFEMGFNTVDAAPIANPYAGEWGYAKTADAINVIGVGSGVATLNGTANGATVIAYGDNTGTIQPIGRVLGRTARWRLPTRTTMPSAGGTTGLGDSGANISMGLRYSTATAVAARDLTVSTQNLTIGSGDHGIAVTEFATGGIVACQNDSGTPQLLWVYPNNSSTMYMKHFPGVSAVNYTLDNLKIFDQSTVTKFQDIATLYQSSPVSGTRYIGTADGLHHLPIILPAVSANLEAVKLCYRMVDGNNYNYFMIKGKSDGTVWEAIFGKFIAGVDTAPTTLASGVGVPTCLIVSAKSTGHNLYTDTGTPPVTQRGAQQTLSLQNTEAGVGAIFDASVTVTQLESYSFTPAALSALF